MFYNLFFVAQKIIRISGVPSKATIFIVFFDAKNKQGSNIQLK